MKKASEIFLNYAEPMMQCLPKGTKAKELQKLLSVPEMVWNALVMRAWGEDKIDHLRTIYEQMGKAGNDEIDKRGMKALIDMWVGRKQQLYPDAKWAFQISVRDDGDGGHIIRACTRIPDHLKHMVPIGFGATFAELAGRYDMEETLRFQPGSYRCKQARTKKNLSLKQSASALRVPQYRLKDIEERVAYCIVPEVLVCPDH